jgi:LmbE family N-acetylglucosaminyl deacetylase
MGETAAAGLERVLVFSPHPDDLELFLGGTVLRHLSEGAAVAVVMMTYGELGSVRPSVRGEPLKRIRRAELEARFRALPAVTLAVWNIPDRGVQLSDATTSRARKTLQDFAPSCVYLPESTKAASYYLHPDHLATGRIVESAAARYDRPMRLRYFHSRAPNAFVDVTAFDEANLAGLRCYRSQYLFTASPPWLLHIYTFARRWRTRRDGRRIGSRFAEAFREVTVGTGVAS